LSELDLSLPFCFLVDFLLPLLDFESPFCTAADASEGARSRCDDEPSRFTVTYEVLGGVTALVTVLIGPFTENSVSNF